MLASAATEHFNKLNEWRRLEMETTPAAPWWRQGDAMAFQGHIIQYYVSWSAAELSLEESQAHYI